MKPYKALAICLLLFACSPHKINGPVLPAVVHFLPPITVGDTWVYSFSSSVNLHWCSNDTETIVVMEVTKHDSDTTIFNVAIRESGFTGSGCLCGCLYDTCPFDTTYRIDSIIVTPNTVVPPILCFSLSTRTTSSWGLKSRGTYNEDYGYCQMYNNLVEYTEVSNVNDFISGGGYTKVFLENVGLISYIQSYSDEEDMVFESSSYTLVTFNGKTPEQISQEPKQ